MEFSNTASSFVSNSVLIKGSALHLGITESEVFLCRRLGVLGQTLHKSDKTRFPALHPHTR